VTAGASTEACACRICGGGAAGHFRAREMMFGTKETFDYFQCGTCACLQVATVPPDLSRFYGPGYYSYGEPTPHRGLRARLVGARNRYLSGAADPLGALVAKFKPFLALASLRPIALARDARIVDVGCGGGELLLALQAVGFRNLLGVDPFVATDLDLGGGLRVLRRELDEVRGEHDLVMFHHSLEHVARQRETLAAAHALLVPGGRCIVRIPTVSSFAWREYGVDWCALDAPRHLYLHSVRSLGLVAAQAGFRVERVVSDSTAFQFWGSEQYRRGIALMTPGSNAIAPAPGAFTSAQLRDFRRRAESLNRAEDGDQIIAYLRRER
jgi:SAM-dependent methyltransferase